jgi:hypothetical protein
MPVSDSRNSWENNFSKILIRLFIALGIIGIIAAVLFDFSPNPALLASFRKIALGIGDARRIQAAGMPKLEAELVYIIKRIKLFLPFFTALIFIWGWLWNLINRTASTVSGNAQQTPPKRYTMPLAGLFFAMGLTLSLRLILFNQSLFYDEIYSFFNFIARDNLLKSITTYMNLNNHLLYSILARGSISIFGNTEWALRLPALIFGLAGIWAFGRLSGLTGNKAIAWVSICLLVFSPAHIDQSQQARGYTALVFFSALSCYFFLRGLKEPDSQIWRKFMLVTVLGFCAHLYMFMVLLAEVVTVIVITYFFRPDKNKSTALDFRVTSRFFLYSTLAGITVFLIYLPALPFIGFEFFRDYPRQKLDLDFLVSMVKFIGPGDQGWDSGLTYLFLFLAGAVFTWRRERAMAILAMNLFLVPVALITLSRPVYLYPRFFIFFLPAYLIVIACGVYGISQKIIPKRTSIIGAIIVAFLVTTALPSLEMIFTKERQNYRQAASIIRRTTLKDTPVIAPGIAGSEIAYYLKDRRIIKVKTLKEVEGLRITYPDAAVLLTYLPTIEPELAEFFRHNYRLLYYDNSRISSVMVYAPKGN